MPKAYPPTAKDQFDFLVEQAESYVLRQSVSPKSLRQWKNRALNWLKDNMADQELSDAMLVVPNNNLHRGLQVLLRARSIVPILRGRSGPKPPKPQNAKRVFIVHGHDAALKTSVARFLSRMGLDPVILHEEPNRGRTIIEKFIEHSDVGFAVVLLTPDDKGGVAASTLDKQRFRARQNVVLELGFFLGKLGRERVAAIYDSQVEMPSDYTGVLFIEHDNAGIWQLALAKEIKASGIEVDLNKL